MNIARFVLPDWVGGLAKQLPRAPTYKLRQDVTEVNGNVLVDKVGHTRTNTSENYPQFGYAISKRFTSPVVGRKL
jgi:hypothetical protein